MISIVMTYYDREFQLKKTLSTLKGENFEVIIVDDNSPDCLKLGRYSFPVKIIRTINKKWTNPEPAYNIGIKQAIEDNADIIILQNAENYHVGNVIEYASKVTDSNYIVFPCYSIDQETTFRPHDIDLIIEKNNIGALKDGQNAWYHHNIFRPVYYDFCAAITTKNMIKLNGYDERFSDGCGYGDDDLLARIRLLGLKIDSPLSPFVVHQWHYSGLTILDKPARVERNKNLHNELLKNLKVKAQHIYTT